MGMQQLTWPLDILGIYFTIASILLVFQVLELQLWVESVNQYLSDFENAGSLTGTARRSAREEWKRRGERLQMRYPTWITYGLGALQIGLFALGLQIDLFWLTDIPWLYTTVPWGGYLILVVGGPIVLVIRGKHSIGKVLRELNRLENT